MFLQIIHQLGPANPAQLTIANFLAKDPDVKNSNVINRLLMPDEKFLWLIHHPTSVGMNFDCRNSEEDNVNPSQVVTQ
uniref:Uncharacterized protein n=1 Tax=Romanomermis culicivorax TaxID=13658 RepID=A0A915IW75_ROMCU